jgi:hypothetical protein
MEITYFGKFYSRGDELKAAETDSGYVIGKGSVLIDGIVADIAPAQQFYVY